MPNERYTVRIAKDQLLFACGHFISFDGHQCERLHGHNYRAEVVIEGNLGNDWYVVDFIALKNYASRLTSELDHHMLLPTKNPVIRLHYEGESIRVTYKDRLWIFPKDDCRCLPIENTTAELLAHYLAHRLLELLQKELNYVPHRIRLEVEENIGQSATYEWCNLAE